MSSWVVPVSALTVYLAWPSTLWNFDGVACAAAIELGDPTYWFHSQHLLYGFLGWLIWKPFSLFFPDLRALTVLQILTPALSTAGLWGLTRAVRSVTGSEASWTASAVVLTAFTPVFWIWSLEPQVYPLGFLGLSWATATLFSRVDRTRWARIGLWHGLAVLGHAVNVLWTIPALAYAWKESSNATQRRTAFTRYAMSLIGTVLVAYSLVFSAVLLPSGKGSDWIWIWLKGSVGLTPTREAAWHWAGWTGAWEWFRVTPAALWGTFQPHASGTLPAWCWMTTALSFGGIGVLLTCSWAQRRHPAWMFSVTWLAVYSVFFWTWEPSMLCYRLTDMAPLALLLALGLKSIRRARMAAGIGGVAAVATALTTWVTQIEPIRDPAKNPTWSQMTQLVQETPENALYITGESKLWIYLLYFTGRQAWYLDRLPQGWSESFAPSRSGRPLYVDQKAFQRPPLSDWPAARTAKPLSSLAWVKIS